MYQSLVCAALLLALVPLGSQAQEVSTAPAPAAAPAPDSAQDIVVTASRADLLGQATTASQGTITREEVALRPIYRPGQLFESIPGLVVTVHSGEGKANQYLIRGYNLDHGTDFAVFVDDMPVNRPTNAHGQGYADLAFLMPVTVAAIDYTKGPYYAGVGDFGSVASSHATLENDLPAQATVTIGTEGYQSLVVADTLHLSAGGRLLGTTEISHYDGPWHPGQNFRKVDALLRYSQGDKTDGFSLTGMFYQSAGLLTTDQPLRAIQAGLIGPYGTLDPSDASRSLRYSLSAHVDTPIGPGQFAASLYGIHSTMTLWNDFTHYLDDPVNGDQEEQDETRTTVGGALAYTLLGKLGSIGADMTIGLQARYDTVFVDRRHTMKRTTILPYCTFEQAQGSALVFPATDGGYCTADRAHLLDVAPYAQVTLRPTPWLRTTLGLREEYYLAADTSFTSGTGGRGHAWLTQPKASVALGPWAKTELYASYGRGFHSNDVRGVFGTVPQQGIPLADGPTPLLAATKGYEIGLRSNVIPRLRLQLAAFQQDFGSELTYNADVGQDEAGAPSRRRGLEVSAQYHPTRWLELNTDLAFSQPRYREADLAKFALTGPYIADSPDFIYSAGVLVDRLGRWSGGLQWRRLGSHSLTDGPREPSDPGYSEWNLDIHYALPSGFGIAVSIFNLFQSRDNAADYYYTSRLQGEQADGIPGYQVHPLEPRSARFSLSKTF